MKYRLLGSKLPRIFLQIYPILFTSFVHEIGHETKTDGVNKFFKTSVTRKLKTINYEALYKIYNNQFMLFSKTKSAYTQQEIFPDFRETCKFGHDFLFRQPVDLKMT